MLWKTTFEPLSHFLKKGRYVATIWIKSSRFGYMLRCPQWHQGSLNPPSHTRYETTMQLLQLGLCRVIVLLAASSELIQTQDRLCAQALRFATELPDGYSLSHPSWAAGSSMWWWKHVWEVALCRAVQCTSVSMHSRYNGGIFFISLVTWRQPERLILKKKSNAIE